jgi:hypothetical protein
MNKKASTLATTGLSRPAIKVFKLSISKALLYVNNSKVMANTNLSKFYSANEAYKYFKNTYNWSDKPLPSI